MATIKGYKADFQALTFCQSEKEGLCSDQGLMLKMSALKPFTVAKLHLLSTQWIILNYPFIIVLLLS